jgi:GABA permease
MRMPIKSETDAFRIAYGSAALIALSVALGALVTPLAGVALFVDRVQPLREALREPPLHSSARSARKRVLVVANQTVGGEELKDEILKRVTPGEPRPELRIIVPVLCSRSHYLTSDIDDEIEQASARLDATVRWAHDQGFEAVGLVGDASPVIAIEDALRRFGADELIISTHIPERSHWLEAGVVERAREELDIPVTHVTVDISRQPAAAAA